MSPRESRPCRACGVDLVFVAGPTGRTIPLQRIRNIYVISGAEAAVRVEPMGGAAEDAGAFWVSHFETCPRASRFSRGKRRGSSGGRS